MKRLIKNKWAEIKNTPWGIVYKILLTCSVIFVCYELSISIFVWTFCGVRELEPIYELEVFLAFCPDEAVQRYENYLFWDECVKKDNELPPNTELLVSACVDPKVRGVPGGEVLFVHEAKTRATYLLDLKTKEKKPVPDDPLLLDQGVFLNSEWVWFEGYSTPAYPDYEPDFILDLTTGKRYELVDITRWGEGGGPKSEYDHYFQSADKIFLHHGRNRAIALPRDFITGSTMGVYLFMFEQETKAGQSLEMYFEELGVNYQVIDFSLIYADIPSPSGKYVAKGSGIFSLRSDISLLPVEYDGYAISWGPGDFISWYYDDSGVVYTQGAYYYYNGLLSSRFRIPRPVLKLNLPEP